MDEKPDVIWLKEEKIPQLSNSLEKRLAYGCQVGGLSKELIAEVDEVVKAACIAIGKHYGREVLICPNCDKLVRPQPCYRGRYFCPCGTWFKEDSNV